MTIRNNLKSLMDSWAGAAIGAVGLFGGAVLFSYAAVNGAEYAGKSLAGYNFGFTDEVFEKFSSCVKDNATEPLTMKRIDLSPDRKKLEVVLSNQEKREVATLRWTLKNGVEGYESAPRTLLKNLSTERMVRSCAHIHFPS